MRRNHGVHPSISRGTTGPRDRRRWEDAEAVSRETPKSTGHATSATFLASSANTPLQASNHGEVHDRRDQVRSWTDPLPPRHARRRNRESRRCKCLLPSGGQAPFRGRSHPSIGYFLRLRWTPPLIGAAFRGNLRRGRCRVIIPRFSLTHLARSLSPRLQVPDGQEGQYQVRFVAFQRFSRTDRRDSGAAHQRTGRAAPARSPKRPRLTSANPPNTQEHVRHCPC